MKLHFQLPLALAVAALASACPAGAFSASSNKRTLRSNTSATAAASIAGGVPADDDGKGLAELEGNLDVDFVHADDDFNDQDRMLRRGKKNLEAEFLGKCKEKCRKVKGKRKPQCINTCSQKVGECSTKCKPKRGKGNKLAGQGIEKAHQKGGKEEAETTEMMCLTVCFKEDQEPQKQQSKPGKMKPSMKRPNMRKPNMMRPSMKKPVHTNPSVVQQTAKKTDSPTTDTPTTDAPTTDSPTTDAPTTDTPTTDSPTTDAPTTDAPTTDSPTTTSPTASTTTKVERLVDLCEMMSSQYFHGRRRLRDSGYKVEVSKQDDEGVYYTVDFIQEEDEDEERRRLRATDVPQERLRHLSEWTDLSSSTDLNTSFQLSALQDTLITSICGLPSDPCINGTKLVYSRDYARYMDNTQLSSLSGESAGGIGGTRRSLLSDYDIEVSQQDQDSGGKGSGYYTIGLVQNSDRSRHLQITDVPHETVNRVLIGDFPSSTENIAVAYVATITKEPDMTIGELCPVVQDLCKELTKDTQTLEIQYLDRKRSFGGRSLLSKKFDVYVSQDPNGIDSHAVTLIDGDRHLQVTGVSSETLKQAIECDNEQCRLKWEMEMIAELCPTDPCADDGNDTTLETPLANCEVFAKPVIGKDTCLLTIKDGNRYHRINDVPHETLKSALATNNLTMEQPYSCCQQCIPDQFSTIGSLCGQT